MKDYQIQRQLIGKMFTNPRIAAAIEKLMGRVAEVDDATTLAVAATNKLNEAAFVTLSANAELPNERILQFGTGISGAITDTTLTLGLSNEAVRAEGGFRIALVAAGDSTLGVPLAGYLATREWVRSSGAATRAVSASATATNADTLILADATAGAVTITLPAAASSAGHRLIIKKTDASANAVTVDGSGAETIDGAATASLTAQYQSIEIVCDGSTWWKV